ncbi:STM4504/CBY_0614 family protein [Variovorax sp. 770b2]|uniref:STM4504/CBY_0614 family protein n=1 Tax=Variovorax sp. 770b2 TaxID=1566271 RepID=UPI0008E0B9AE|nr:hypothetical protein [Variovorax sp. 770b2]SFP15249.1 hypothetical protein SAMN03159339_0594 [Variovorax sp. 770b2]
MVFDLYSKRQKRLRGESPDFYIYDEIPFQLKVQIVFLWELGLGDIDEENPAAAYKLIVQTLREEYGNFSLAKVPYDATYFDELRTFFLSESDTERVLDAIELSFKALSSFGRAFNYRRNPQANELVEKAISDLNIRFKEHGLGYQFTNNEIIRIDSELIHAEVVKPVLRLLNQPYFKGAEDEYLAAHEHYRHGNTKEALVECLKSFESAMMGICKKRGWAYGEKDTAKTLIDICMANGLIPTFWQSQLNGLRSMLEGAVPTGRNRLAGHGQGADPTEVPTHLVSYMMHMTASTLKFLVEADTALR